MHGPALGKTAGKPGRRARRPWRISDPSHPQRLRKCSAESGRDSQELLSLSPFSTAPAHDGKAQGAQPSEHPTLDWPSHYITQMLK